MSESEPDDLETTKVFLEYLKHLTTLSTGSIILITTFLERLFSKPLWKAAVIIALVGFMLSVLSSVVAYTVAVFFDATKREPPSWIGFLGGYGIVFTWLGFLVGILSLAVFSVRNFLG